MSIRDNRIVRWLARFWFAQHNSRVIEDFEMRMSLLVEDATGGRMSKPYYTIEAMRAEMQAHHNFLYEDGYKDALEELGDLSDKATHLTQSEGE